MVGDADGALRCPRCDKRWPASYSACPNDGTALAPRTVASDVHDAETRLVAGGSLSSDQDTIEEGPRVDSVRRLVEVPRPAIARRQAQSTKDLENDTDRREESSVVSINEMTPVVPPDWDRTTIPPVLANARIAVAAVDLEHTQNANEKLGSELTPLPTRVWEEGATIERPTAQTDDVADREQAAEPSMAVIRASTRYPFDPNDSDARTPPVGRKPFSEQEARSPETKSSDPPTVFARRHDDHIALPPGSVVDEYEIDRRLGAGAMGEVYAARHLKLGKRVAIKVISPRLSEDTAAIERFAQEARTLAGMHHPGLVDVLGFGELADGRAYFVMEYLRGETLFDRLARGRLAEDEALDVFDQIARALEAAHTHGVIHRDLKPENTFLVRVANEQRPIVKLLDFGLAKLAVEVDRRAERTQSGVVIGTAMYLSPEQARGPNVDHRTDIYALGCIAYEIFLGGHPFSEARTVAALIAAHLHETPPMPRSISPRIPPQLDLLLFAMLAKDPAYRPTLPQIRAVAAERLGAAIAGVRSPTPFTSAPQRTWSPGEASGMAAARSLRRTTIMIAGAAMIAGIVIGVAASGSKPSEGSRSPYAFDSATDAKGGDVTGEAQAIDALASETPLVNPSATEPPLTNPQMVATPTATAERGSAVAVARNIRPQALGDGILRLISKPSCDIVVDGKSTGLRTPQPEIKLPAGRHRITLVNDKYSIKETFVIEIKARETETEIRNYSDRIEK